MIFHIALYSLTAYGVSLVLLYTASAVYHGVRNPEIKRALRIMDHCSMAVQRNAEKLQNAPRQHKQVPDKVHILSLGFVEDDPGGIGLAGCCF